MWRQAFWASLNVFGRALLCGFVEDFPRLAKEIIVVARLFDVREVFPAHLAIAHERLLARPLIDGALCPLSLPADAAETRQCNRDQ